MAADPGTMGLVDPEHIEKNPQNPRRFFNDARLDLLRTSIQEAGILVPLIVYRRPDNPDRLVLMDGERRWRSSLDLGISQVPVNIIAAPSPLENLVKMFNIHSVREDWPLVSVALSLAEMIRISGETRESRLAEMTGLTRSEVRRAKRLMSLPEYELELIQREAHLDRQDQIHREDLYLEIDAAESVLRNSIPELAGRYTRAQVIRQFARKREIGSLVAVTEFRDVGKLVKATDEGLVDRAQVVEAASRLVEDETLTPSRVFAELGAAAYQQQSAARKAELLAEDLDPIIGQRISVHLRAALEALVDRVRRVLEASDD